MNEEELEQQRLEAEAQAKLEADPEAQAAAAAQAAAEAAESERQAEIKRLATEQADVIVRERMAQVQPQAPAPSGAKSPVQQAREEAEALSAKGQFASDDWVMERALEIQGERVAKTVVGAMAPALSQLYQKDAVKTVAGENAHAQEYAQKFIAKGVNVNDPEVADLIRRASANYAQEKTPAKLSIRSEKTEGNVPTISPQDRQAANSLLGLAPQYALTDAEIAEAMAS